MRAKDRRLVAALTVLRDGLAPVVDGLLAGELEPSVRRDLAGRLRQIAGELDPVVDGSVVAPAELTDGSP